ncbi:MAG TPA: Gfo/Idh/MocA family oxidoreductase [Chthoniobacteraceae bacterium]|nr:Gfo/Idh/MocA family oxidoreductase [Chthoniobacteraceae bacterium]
MPTSCRIASPLKTVILGLGRAGWRLHLLPMQQHGGFEIIGVVDPEEDRCQEAAQACGAVRYASLDEALKRSDAVLYVVATPSFSHFEEAGKILRAGRHCILEKPMALCLEEAATLVSLAHRNHARLFVHHSLLHQPEFHRLKAVKESRVLGPLFHIRAFWGGYRRRWDWQTLKKNGGGQINNSCSHLFSMLLPLLDSPVVSLWADCRNIKDAGDAEDHVEINLKTESGLTAVLLISSAMVQKGPRWILAGKHGTLSSDGKKSQLTYYHGAGLPIPPVIDGAAPGRRYSCEVLDWQKEETLLSDQPLPPSFHQNVVDVLCHGSEPFITPECAMEVVRLTEWVHRATNQPTHPSIT